MALHTHSQLQLQVLRLYRECLKASRRKKGAEDLVKSTFRTNAQIDRTNIILIEHLLRRGHRQLKMLQSSENVTVL